MTSSPLFGRRKIGSFLERLWLHPRTHILSSRARADGEGSRARSWGPGQEKLDPSRAAVRSLGALRQPRDDKLPAFWETENRLVPGAPLASPAHSHFVIPSPRRRRGISRKVSVSGPREAGPNRATVRSLGALRQPRDDRALSFLADAKHLPSRREASTATLLPRPRPRGGGLLLPSCAGRRSCRRLHPRLPG